MKMSIAIILIILSLSLCGCQLIPDMAQKPAQPTQAATAPIPAAPVTQPPVTVPPVTEPPVTEPPVTEPALTEPPVTKPEPADDDFVLIRDYIPDALIELPYATPNNFTGQVIYDFTEPMLRYGTVKKLMQVQQRCKEDGYLIKIWDGFRPASAQFRLWEICPDPTYVANPNNGYSSHTRGNTVDITLVYADGTAVEMPTTFDDFSLMADRDFSDCTPEGAKNAAYLEEIMIENGFSGYYGEWWHYTDTTTYPVETQLDPGDM